MWNFCGLNSPFKATFSVSVVAITTNFKSCLNIFPTFWNVFHQKTSQLSNNPCCHMFNMEIDLQKENMKQLF